MCGSVTAVYGAWRGCGDAGSKGLFGKRLEKIHTEPHLTTICKLAAALGVDPRELLED
jgi:hypothetical protein